MGINKLPEEPQLLCISLVVKGEKTSNNTANAQWLEEAPSSQPTLMLSLSIENENEKPLSIDLLY